MKKKFVFIDIDGTLFDHKKRCIPSSALVAMEKAIENGHKLFICTGRPFPDLEKEMLELPVDGYILSCGAQVQVNNIDIFLSPFPAEDLKRIASFMVENGIGFSLEGKQRNYMNKEAYEFFKDLILSEIDEESSEVAKVLLKEREMYHYNEITEEDWKQILKISLFSSNREKCKEMIDKLPEHLYGFLHENPHLDLLNGEITIKGINKASGIDCILEYFNHPLEDTIAIGDSMNDI